MSSNFSDDERIALELSRAINGNPRRLVVSPKANSSSNIDTAILMTGEENTLAPLIPAASFSIEGAHQQFHDASFSLPKSINNETTKFPKEHAVRRSARVSTRRNLTAETKLDNIVGEKIEIRGSKVETQVGTQELEAPKVKRIKLVTKPTASDGEAITAIPIISAQRSSMPGASSGAAGNPNSTDPASYPRHSVRNSADSSIDPSTVNPSNDVYQDSNYALDTFPGIPQARTKRGLKRKSSDDDFNPPGGPMTSDSQEELILTSLEERSIKRKPAQVKGKRARYVKYYQPVQEEKPLPYGKPPVWAEKRQALCEALPYYRAHMSGAYMFRGMVKAFMADKEVGPRDKFNEEIMIARVGGGRKLDEDTGIMVQKADQNKSTFGLGFQRAKDSKSPVAVIAGRGNRICPTKLPHYYNVLDWFHVTDVWCEVSNGFKCWMVRLEKVHLDIKSWWAPFDSGEVDFTRDLNAYKTIIKSCATCQRESKEIYNAGWTCLQTSCPVFFHFEGQVDHALLNYNTAFMNERTIFRGECHTPLVPPLVTDQDIAAHDGCGFEDYCKMGIVCPKCNGCSRRIEWCRWFCETPGCDFEHRVAQRIVTVAEIDFTKWFDPERPNEDHPKKEYFNEAFGIRFEQKIMGQYDVFEYSLPGPGDNEIAGVIRHFKPVEFLNELPDGANDLFRQMQETDFGLKRNPARQKDSTGEVLTSHWAANWGAPYKYGVSVISKGFDEAPLVLIKTIKRLTWAGEQTVSKTDEPFTPFNELLSIGYFEDTAIGYHDDGEKELGPTVATLSLGASACMTFRPKAKSGLGPKSKNAKGTKATVVRITLEHGDIVVMDGSGIQKLYEHAVMPLGTLRFALTCRYVRPELMANEKERRLAEIKGRLPAGHEQYNYDGDIGKDLTLARINRALSENVPEVLAIRDAFDSIYNRGDLSLEDLRRSRELATELNGLLIAPTDAPEQAEPAAEAN